MTAESTISTMVDRIVGRFHPSRVVLFGSYARGTAIESSDVDLLVVMGDIPDKRQAAGRDTTITGRPSGEQGHRRDHSR